MPGIFINDGGQTSSTLGNILGGIAANVGPEAAAKAQLLYQQTQGADLANQNAFELQQAAERAYNQRAGLLGTLGADAGAPTVAGTAASLAQPPTPVPNVGPGGRVSRLGPSGTPLEDYSGYELLRGDLPPSALTTLSTLGQTAVNGPGNDWATQAEIAKANKLPYDLPVGTSRHFPTVPAGTSPGAVVEGGSPVEQDVQAATAKEALADQSAGPQASDAIAKLAALQALRNTVVQGHFTPGDVIYDEAAKKADAFFGTGAFSRLNNRLDIMNAIRGGMKSITAATRLAYAGDPALRGLSAQLDESLPDPESDQFDNSVNGLTKTLSATVDDANAANDFLKNPASPGNADAFRSGKLARHAAAAAAVTEALKPGGGGGGGGKRWIWNSKTGQTELQQ